MFSFEIITAFLSTCVYSGNATSSLRKLRNDSEKNHVTTSISLSSLTGSPKLRVHPWPHNRFACLIRHTNSYFSTHAYFLSTYFFWSKLFHTLFGHLLRSLFHFTLFFPLFFFLIYKFVNISTNPKTLILVLLRIFLFLFALAFI